MELKVGNIYVAREFCYTNKSGGTNMSNSEFNESFELPVQVKVTQAWEDYECGWRSHAKPLPGQKELEEYLDRNARSQNGGVTLYVGEFDIDKDATKQFWLTSKRFEL